MIMKKKLLSILLVLPMIMTFFASSLTTYASGYEINNIHSQAVSLSVGSNFIKVGDTSIHTDHPAFIDPGTNAVMIPAGIVALLLGIPQNQITWGDGGIMTIVNGGRTIQFIICSDQLIVNGVNDTMYSTDGLPVRAVIFENELFAPSRYVALALGVDYEWEVSTQTVIFNSKDWTNTPISYRNKC